MTMSKFNKNLLYFRKNANMTQETLAKKLGVSTNNIGHWEKGRTEPNIDMLLKICEVLNVTIDELIN